MLNTMLLIRQNTCQLRFACFQLLLVVVENVALLNTSMNTMTRYVWPTAAKADCVKVWLLQVTLMVQKLGGCACRRAFGVTIT